ncbi:hypothetical protein KCP78_17370 [Salmonella enterica subsp. enterica]|nr:hypothetical protein KCP78_17370 [Salmonella enterica subsp. enterica]
MPEQQRYLPAKVSRRLTCASGIPDGYRETPKQNANINTIRNLCRRQRAYHIRQPPVFSRGNILNMLLRVKPALSLLFDLQFAQHFTRDQYNTFF